MVELSRREGRQHAARHERAPVAGMHAARRGPGMRARLAWQRRPRRRVPAASRHRREAEELKEDGGGEVCVSERRIGPSLATFISQKSHARRAARRSARLAMLMHAQRPPRAHQAVDAATDIWRQARGSERAAGWRVVAMVPVGRLAWNGDEGTRRGQGLVRDGRPLWRASSVDLGLYLGASRSLSAHPPDQPISPRRGVVSPAVPRADSIGLALRGVASSNARRCAFMCQCSSTGLPLGLGSGEARARGVRPASAAFPTPPLRAGCLALRG